MSKEFNFDEALTALRNGQDLTGKDGILTPLEGVQNSVSANIHSAMWSSNRPSK